MVICGFGSLFIAWSTSGRTRNARVQLASSLSRPSALNVMNMNMTLMMMKIILELTFYNKSPMYNI